MGLEDGSCRANCGSLMNPGDAPLAGVKKPSMQCGNITESTLLSN